MKKLLILLFLFSLTGCRAQYQQFDDDVEYQEPTFTTVTGKISMNENGTASLVQNNEYQRVFHFDSRKDMVEGWEYVVRLRLGHPEDLKQRDLLSATLVGYAISPKQARVNAVKVSKRGGS